MKNTQNAFLNILSAILLVILFGGLIYIVNQSYSRSIQTTRALLERQATSGPAATGFIQVDHSVCHYVRPNNFLDSALGFVLCPSCVQQAAWINANFKVILKDASCARRGANTMNFIYQPPPKE